MGTNSILQIENISDKKLLVLCLEASKNLNCTDDRMHKLFLINRKSETFEENFRVNLSEFCRNKDETFFISLRGIFEEYSNLYQKKYDGDYPPSRHKDKFSIRYRTAQKTIKKLFEQHYIADNEYQEEEIKRIHEIIETTIKNLEVTEGSLRQKANAQTGNYLSRLGLPKSSIEKILTFFRTQLTR